MVCGTVLDLALRFREDLVFLFEINGVEHMADGIGGFGRVKLPKNWFEFASFSL